MVKIRYLGHACFEILTSDKVLYIDPYLTGNPESPIKPSDVKKADLILVTHDHYDHLGDSVEIARKTNATIVSVPELSQNLGQVKKFSMSLGAFVRIEGVQVAMVPAVHTSLKGLPVGYVIEAEGRRLYHTGDTAVFGDMKLIKELYRPGLVMLPIGGHYVMGPMEAAYALKLLEPEVAIPMHYKTFPILVQDTRQFEEEAKRYAPNVNIKVLKPNETYEYR
jgi:L-ascorbate metabolism protein UlaG (beta-lactamase superfamily)